MSGTFPDTIIFYLRPYTLRKTPMQSLETLISEVETARQQFISAVKGMRVEQATFRPNDLSWSPIQITEHIVRAEQIGVMGMWKSLLAFQSGTTLWQGPNPNAGLTIEEVVANTWAPKEQVPEVAKPIWGGPLAFWIASLEANTHPLQALETQLQGVDMEHVIYPHPISGPLHVVQRLQFLRFHLNRHQRQVETIRQHPHFPSAA